MLSGREGPEAGASGKTAAGDLLCHADCSLRSATSFWEVSAPDLAELGNGRVQGDYDSLRQGMIPAVQAMADVNPDSSVNLLLKAQSGDDEALNGLLARYLPRLQRWAKGRLPLTLRTMLDTGDIVQDAVMNAVRHLDTFEIRTDGALQAYLRRAVKNRITDVYRHAARQPTVQAFSDEVVAKDKSPLEQAINGEALQRYARALELLKDEERQAVVLRVERGFSYREIANQLGKPSAAAARMTVSRALARLAGQMSGAVQKLPD